MVGTMRRKLRRAVGLVKDQASLTKAIIFSGDVAGGLKTAVVQATTHDDSSPIDDSFVHEILFLVSNSPDSVLLLSNLITKRLQRTHDAVVALKLLILVHRLLRGGHSRFENDLRVAHSYGELRLTLDGVRLPPKERPSGLVSFIHDYASFLEQRMGWFINQAGRLELTTTKPDTKVFDSVFIVLPRCQLILDRIISCFPGPAIVRQIKLVQSAMDVILRESFHLYVTFEEGVTTLAGLLNQESTRIDGLHLGYAMQILKKASEQNYELVKFFENCKKVCNVRCEDSPRAKIVISREDIVKMVEKMSGCGISGESADIEGGCSSCSSSPASVSMTPPEREVDKAFSDRLETKVSTEWVVFGDDDGGGSIDSSCWRGNPFVEDLIKEMSSEDLALLLSSLRKR